MAAATARASAHQSLSIVQDGARPSPLSSVAPSLVRSLPGTHDLSHVPCTCPQLPRSAAEDGALLRGLLRRDPRAWRSFATAYGALMKHAIQKVLRRFPRRCAEGDVEDVHAALMCSLLERDMHKLRCCDPAQGALANWLHLLATNAAWTHLRVCVRHLRLAGSDEQLIELPADARDPFEVLDAKQSTLRMQEQLRALPERDLSFLDLCYREDHSVEQVADRLKITVATVYCKKNRIQTRLRRARDAWQEDSLAVPPR